MQLINGIPNIIEGMAYYPHILVPNEAFGREMYEINLAIDDSTFEQFNDEGYIGLHHAGKKKFTPDPVITFQRFAYSHNGKPNKKPRLVDTENKDIDVAIGNGSRVKVMWKHSEYGKQNRVKRPELVAVQIVDLVPYESSGDNGFIDPETVEFD